MAEDNVGAGGGDCHRCDDVGHYTLLAGLCKSVAYIWHASVSYAMATCENAHICQATPASTHAARTCDPPARVAPAVPAI
eukprot:364886-Chlamydomonas_euryale.AAC.9